MKSARSGTVPSAHVGRCPPLTCQRRCGGTAPRSRGTARTQRPREVVHWSPTANWAVKRAAPVTHRGPRRTYPAFSRDKPCASEWKKLGGDRADDSKNRTRAGSTRLYDALTRLTALGRYARELFNWRCKRVSKNQRCSQPCELTTCVHASQTYTHEP